jgi:RNA polymerase sigma factor (sigma-70 family)
MPMTIALRQSWAVSEATSAIIPRTPAMTEQQLISGCKASDRRAQRAVYDRHSQVMLAVARRYTARDADAEDVLVSAFFKVFDKIGTFTDSGSFEGWIRRIVVNEALMLLRKKHALKQALEIEDVNPAKFSVPAEAASRLAEADIMNLLDRMPTGYRTVFNLYVVEGYKHREIAEMLGISINTSKSQLILARKRMREQLIALGYGAS